MAEHECKFCPGLICFIPRCSGCGWYPPVIEERKLQIKHGGLSEDHDGLKRLHVSTTILREESTTNEPV